MLKMLWTGEYDEAWDKKFSEIVEVKKAGFAITNDIPSGVMDEDTLIEALKGIDIFLVGYDEITEKVLYHSPDLKLILSVRDGPEENIDLAACEKYGIPVVSSAGRCTESVAELNVELMLLLARNTIQLTNRMRAEGLTEDNRASLRAITVSSTELFEKTLGIIGLGRNGRRLAQLVKGFDMRVIAYDPFVSAEAMKELNVEKYELNDLMKEADYVSVLARLSSETERMVGREQIEMMKDTAYLVNTGRAKLVDNEALWDALLEDKIKGAAVDVFEPEIEDHITTDQRFYKIPAEKLIMTPHTAGATMERVNHQSRNLYDQMTGFFKGVRPYGLVTRNVFESEGFNDRGGKIWNVEE